MEAFMNLFDVFIALWIGAAVVALCGLSLRMGFKMGRMTVDKPTGEPKQYNPGQPAVAEEDPWDLASQPPKEGADAAVMETMK
jgi:hypothetical protein